jgi:hypothetical protein
MIICANARHPGTHSGSLTMPVGSELSAAYLLGTYNNTTGKIDACSATDMPYGIISDAVEKEGDRACIHLLGCGSDTLVMTMADSVTAGGFLYTAANGRVSSVAVAGAYLVGMALHAGESGDLVEVVSCLPRVTS